MTYYLNESLQEITYGTFEGVLRRQEAEEASLGSASELVGAETIAELLDNRNAEMDVDWDNDGINDGYYFFLEFDGRQIELVEVEEE